MTPPNPTSWLSDLKFSSLLRVGLQSGLFPSGLPTKTLYVPVLSPVRATCPAHLILLDFITSVIWCGVQIMKLFFMQFSQVSCQYVLTSSSAPYSPTPSITVLYIFIFMCTQGRIKLFGAPRQWKHFRPLFQAVFLSGGGVLPPRLSQTPRLPVPRQK